MGRDCDRLLGGLGRVRDHLEAVAAQLVDDLGVVDDGAEAHERAALVHSVLHHLDGAADAEAEAHLARPEDFHVSS